ncbi:MAG: hypothetical protein HKM93_01455 [Desulfobacteraceae bacterium]|nr:hypothetical protein [Desulfobacteraceae bacterium]
MSVPEIHSRNAIFIVVCVAGLLGIGFFGILPNNNTLSELDLEAAAVNEKIINQKALAPVFQNLIKRVQEKDDHHLKLPEKLKMPPGDIDQITNIFRQYAEKNGLDLISASSDVESLSDDTGFMGMQLRLSGDFFKFRQMLIDLEELPYLERIEKMTISSDRTSKLFELKLLVAQQ